MRGGGGGEGRGGGDGGRRKREGREELTRTLKWSEKTLVWFNTQMASTLRGNPGASQSVCYTASLVPRPPRR